MGWLQLVGSFQFYVSFAEYRPFCRVLLQKRPIILRSLLIIATPYFNMSCHDLLGVCHLMTYLVSEECMWYRIDNNVELECVKHTNTLIASANISSRDRHLPDHSTKKTPNTSSHSKSLIDYDKMSLYKPGERGCTPYHIIIFYVVFCHISNMYIYMIVTSNIQLRSRSLIDYDILPSYKPGESGCKRYYIILHLVLQSYMYIYIYETW